MTDPELYILKYGEEHRQLITNALRFMDTELLTIPDFDIDEYLTILLNHLSEESKDYDS